MSDDDSALNKSELLVWLYDFKPTDPVPKDFVWRMVKLMKHLHAELPPPRENSSDE